LNDFGFLMQNETEQQIGKALGLRVYVHVDAIPSASSEHQDLINRARIFTGISDDAFNVVRINAYASQVSFLLYPRFFEDPMRRREFITLVGGAAATWPLFARAQQAERMRRIGVLMGFAENDSRSHAHMAAFRDGLQKLGWTESRNIRIDTRWAAFDAESRQRFAKELITLRPDLILSHSTPTTAELLLQTRTIPIIFATVTDPVGSGFVASLPRPGGNVTGFTLVEPTMAAKWVELLKEIAPRVNRVAMLFNPATATYADYFLKPFKAAAPSFAVEAIAAPARGTSELESVFAAQVHEPLS
jgi:ABC-type uncharacterized transport system substrate-binding protein